MIFEEEKDINDVDSFDPEDDEVETEDESEIDSEFTPESDSPETEGENTSEEETDLDNSAIDEDEEVLDVEVKKYLITGLVDYTDETGNITGQYPKGTIQLLPAFVGDMAVEAGQAEEVE